MIKIQINTEKTHQNDILFKIQKKVRRKLQNKLKEFYIDDVLIEIEEKNDLFIHYLYSH